MQDITSAFLWNLEINNFVVYPTEYNILNFLEKEPSFLVAFPDQSGKCLLFNNQTKELTQIGEQIKKYSNYTCSVSVNGGAIAFPEYYNECLFFDSNTLDIVKIPFKCNAEEKYNCCAAVDGGAIAFPSSANRCLFFDPVTKKLSKIGPKLTGEFKYGCCAAVDGGAIAFPCDFNSCLFYNSDTKEILVIGYTSDEGFHQYECCVAVDGGAIAFPSSAEICLFFDSDSKELTKIGPVILQALSEYKYRCAVAIDGGAIAFPCETDSCLIYSSEFRKITEIKSKFFRSYKYISAFPIDRGESVIAFSSKNEKKLVYNTITKQFCEIELDINKKEILEDDFDAFSIGYEIIFFPINPKKSFLYSSGKVIEIGNSIKGKISKESNYNCAALIY